MEDKVLQLIDSYSANLLSSPQQEEFQWISFSPNIKPNIKITFIEDSSKFLRHSSNTWLWYKNLNIPAFSFSVSSCDESSEPIHSDAFFMELFCFKEPEENLQSLKPDGKTLFSLSQLQGSTSIKLEDNQSQISGVKFFETSFNSKGLKFGLVFLIRDENLNIIEARISPLIFVESRKKSHQERQSGFGLFDPFLPENLEKTLVKSSTKSIETFPIQEDFEGIYNYFTSFQIRHKILHPFFLFMKFPRAIRLFYNSNQVCDTSKPCEIFTTIQQLIYDLLVENKGISIVKNDCKGKEHESFQNKLIILCLNIKADSPFSQANTTVKRVIKYLKPLHGQILSFSPCLLLDMPSNFVEFKYSEDLKSIYKKLYSDLSNQKMQMNFCNPDEIQQQKNDKKRDESTKKQESFKPQQFSPSNVFSMQQFSQESNQIVRKESINQLEQISICQINQETPENSLRSILKLNTHSPTKRSKLHKFPVLKGRQPFLKIKSQSSNQVETNSPKLIKKTKFIEDDILDCQKSYKLESQDINSPIQANFSKYQMGNSSSFESIVNQNSKEMIERTNATGQQQTIPTFSNLSILPKQDMEINQQRQGISTWQDPQSLIHATNQPENSFKQEIQNDQKQDYSTKFNMNNNCSLPNQPYFPCGNQNMNGQLFNMPNSNTTQDNKDNSNYNENLNNENQSFNPFYCFMLQQQQILQLQESYIQELKKNAQLESQNKSVSSTSVSYLRNHNSYSNKDCSQSSSNNQYDQQNRSFSQNNSSTSSQELCNKRRQQENSSNQSLSSQERIQPTNHSESSFIPSKEQLKELFSAYMKMADKKDENSTQTDQANGSPQDSQADEAGLERNQFYFEKILIPLFQNVNSFINHPGKNKVTKSISSSISSRSLMESSRRESSRKHQHENIQNLDKDQIQSDAQHKKSQSNEKNHF